MLPCSNRFTVHVLALALTLAQTGSGEGNEELYRRVAASTAAVYKMAGPFHDGCGTGFLIDAQERLLVTARHVIEKTGGGVIEVPFILFAQSADGEIITDEKHYQKNWQSLAVRGKVVYESVRRDMAILQLEKLPAGLKPLVLAAKPARPGQLVHVVGNSTQNLGGLFSYCQGHVRNVFRWEDLGATIVTTQAPMNKGDSGGPMVNHRGEVIAFGFMTGSSAEKYKTSPLYDMQVTGLGLCVSEIHEGLKEMRGQRLAQGEKPGAQSPKMAGFKGQAQAGVHLVMMEKDTLYRIRVKADGFMPDMRIDNILISTTPAAGRELEHLFTPKETKEYRIQVTAYPGRDVVKGAARYTFSVDQVSFQPHTTLKEARLTLNEHARKLQAGKVYRITVRGKGFEPDVQILDGTKTVLAKHNNGVRAEAGVGQRFFEGLGLTETFYETSFTFVPAKTQEYRVLVAVSPFSPSRKEPLDYNVEIAEPKVEFSVSGQLTAKDPVYPQSGPFKAHAVKLEAGKTYQIDLITTMFDGVLLLEESTGKVVMKGFDAEGLNSRLVFRPAQSDTYRIVVTTRDLNVTGPYTLAVTENSRAQPDPPRFDKRQSPNSK